MMMSNIGITKTGDQPASSINLINT